LPLSVDFWRTFLRSRMSDTNEGHGTNDALRDTSHFDTATQFSESALMHTLPYHAATFPAVATRFTGNFLPPVFSPGVQPRKSSQRERTSRSHPASLEKSRPRSFMLSWLNIKCVFSFSLQLLSETLLILRRIQRDIINVRTSSCKVPVITVRFSWKSVQ
jgi:hypothetical protein